MELEILNGLKELIPVIAVGCSFSIVNCILFIYCFALKFFEKQDNYKLKQLQEENRRLKVDYDLLLCHYENQKNKLDSINYDIQKEGKK